MQVIYKIRHRCDGLFSTGGHYPKWEKNGKSWTKLGYLRRHLSEVGLARARQIYEDCDVIEYRMVEGANWPMDSEIQDAIDKRDKKIEAQRKRHQEYIEKKKIEQELAEKQQLKELLNKWGHVF